MVVVVWRDEEAGNRGNKEGFCSSEDGAATAGDGGFCSILNFLTADICEEMILSET